MAHTEKHLDKRWFANETKLGARGVQGWLLEEQHEVYLRYHHKNGYRYGVFEALEAAELVEDGDHHLYELIPKKYKRKFYLDYDTNVPNDKTTVEEHLRALEELQKKVVADAELLCGHGHAVFFGSWGVKENYMRYSLHMVRPDRYFHDQVATIHMSSLAKRIGADPSIYKVN